LTAKKRLCSRCPCCFRQPECLERVVQIIEAGASSCSGWSIVTMAWIIVAVGAVPGEAKPPILRMLLRPPCAAGQPAAHGGRLSKDSRASCNVTAASGKYVLHALMVCG
jgi:hypothetical protein